MKKRLGSLFSKAIIVLSIVSIVPVVIIGYHVLRVDSRVLKNEVLDKQRTVALQIASVLRNNVGRKAQLFSIFTDLHTDFGGHSFIDKEDIDYLRERYPDITHISVLNRNGRQLFYSSAAQSRFSYAAELPNIIQTCVDQGKDYVGSINRTDDTLYSLMAFPLRVNRHDRDVSGVLVVEMDLRDLGETLAGIYPPDLNILVISDDASLISYNGAPGGLALEPDPARTKLAAAIRRLLDGRQSAELTLPDDKPVLVSASVVQVTDWTVYVYQPADMIKKLLLQSTFYSFLDVLIILLGMVFFLVTVSYLVIIPIVKPVKSLQRAALRLSESDDYTPTASDISIPNNEIGDLARVFLQMSEALRHRTVALIQAQQQLAGVNQQLEERVEERTRELQAATEELVKAERLAAIGQMASIISHEIRNPLAVISNSTRLIKLLAGQGADPKLSKQLGIIEAEIKQASNIINEVLGYARSRELILTAIDLNSYIHEILVSYPVSCGVKIAEELDPESVKVKIDAEEIKQAIRNVLSNACEAMQGNGKVTVGTHVGKKMVCIFIQDEGPGISQELREKIFSPFFTTKARGTGLGLAVVRKAMTRHRGKLFISSEAGKGTCFQLYLRIYNKLGDTRYGEAS